MKQFPVKLTYEEITALIASLNFTKPKSKCWLPVDNEVLTKLKVYQEAIRQSGRSYGN